MSKIMTIEDSAFERKAIINMLAKGNYKEVVEAETGEEGIELFKKEKPDLVLLDLRLPGMDGIECFKKLKKEDPRVKVIIVSIVTRQESVDECMKLGAKAYIMKPVTQKKLLDPIKTILK
ncbi:response regulator [Candidatus Woesearchaeota archaeon]|jgi:DNA-binding NarL/FixJ family response regulator|nr:response regulator [Candidatus Woesearchaeota archaeon]MBT5272297.1 response regulator [Candidatus Woesearchaeota archaeon]MBT6040626.1 response regulator [Candidatus Woesearchaeota archaeon]MBT6336569.1 response regulator [Candidatus Woesearchaeota archaeon]MBT7927459.1 response regulator [Candidatus Woesearchaeota archaeon]